MNSSKSPEELEALRAKRRQERWSAFLTPLITLASIVISISLLMFFIKTCNERVPQRPGIQRTPLHPTPR